MRIYVGNVNIKSILFSGACFRTIEENDGSITNIFNDRVVNIKQDGEYIDVISSNMNNIEEVIKEYFDLNRDYDYINNKIIENNIEFKEMINKCLDYRILNQDSFEMIISYIISQNNNVKRISKSINMLCSLYGEEIHFNDKTYYLFPKYEVLKKLTCEDFRNLGVGFRDKYLIDCLEKYETLSDLDKFSTEECLNKLMAVKGIGLKVASCILLFGYKRLDVFPIDTWVKKYMVSHYNIKDDIKVIKEFALNNFKEYSGLIIQYMFHSERNN